MKKIVVTRFGVANVTNDWFDYSIDLFATITLPSLEANADNNTFFILLVSEIVPNNAIVRINELIRHSSARGCFRIIKVLPGWNCKAGRQAYVFECLINDLREILHPDEWFMIHNLDADDALIPDYFLMVENVTKQKFKNGLPHKCVIQFPEGASLILSPFLMTEYVTEFGSNNCTIISNNLLDSLKTIDCHRLQEVFFNRNSIFMSYKEYNSKVNWIRVFHSNSTFGARSITESLKNTRGANLLKNKIYNAIEILTSFHVSSEKVTAFSSKHPQEFATPHQNVDLDKSCITDSLSKIKKDYEEHKTIMQELLDYNDLKKTKISVFLSSLKESLPTYKQVLNTFYNSGATEYAEHALEFINDYAQYIITLEKDCNGLLACFMAYSDGECSYAGTYIGGVMSYKINSDSVLMAQAFGHNTGSPLKNVVLQASNGYSQINVMGRLLGLNQRGLNIVVFEEFSNDMSAKFIDSKCFGVKLLEKKDKYESTNESIGSHMRRVFKPIAQEKPIDSGMSKVDSKSTNTLTKGWMNGMSPHEFYEDQMASLLKLQTELWFANVFNSTIATSAWLFDKSFSPRGSAANYSMLYALYRLLDEFQPKSILEIGMGQTTKMISQYASYKKVSHYVVEHNKVYINAFQQRLSKNSSAVQLDLLKKDGCFQYKDFHETFKGHKFDFIVVDGPFGNVWGEKSAARIDTLSIVPNCFDDKWIILIDDAERIGEKRMIEMLKEKLNTLTYATQILRGKKSQHIFASDGFQHLTKI